MSERFVGRRWIAVATVLWMMTMVSSAVAEKRRSVQIADDAFLAEPMDVALVLVTDTVDLDTMYRELSAMLAAVVVLRPDGERLKPFRPTDAQRQLFAAGITDPGAKTSEELATALGADALLIVRADGAKRVTHHDRRIDADLEVTLYREGKLLVFGDAGMLAHGLQKPRKVVIKSFRKMLLEVAEQYRANGHGIVSGIR